MKRKEIQVEFECIFCTTVNTCTLIYISTIDTYVFMYFFNIQVEISIICKDGIS